jgi:hypothetical protein
MNMTEDVTSSGNNADGVPLGATNNLVDAPSQESDDDDMVEIDTEKAKSTHTLNTKVDDDGSVRIAESNSSHLSTPLSLPNYDPRLVAYSSLYTVLLILLFALPALILNNATGDGWSSVSTAIGVTLLLGGGALLVAVVTISVAGCRWAQLSTRMKVIALYPVVSIVTIFLVMILLWNRVVEQSNNTNQDHDDAVWEPICPHGVGDGLGCNDSPILHDYDHGGSTNSTTTTGQNLRRRF